MDRELEGRLPAYEEFLVSATSKRCWRNRCVSILPRGPWDAMRAMISNWVISSCPPNDRADQPVRHPPRSPFFPDPLRFDPERFTTEAKAQRTKFTYFPFGAGFRQCIGESFAWMEGVLVLATLAQRWKLSLVPNHPVEPEPLITLRPKFGMKMIVEPRNSIHKS